MVSATTRNSSLTIALDSRPSDIASPLRARTKNGHKWTLRPLTGYKQHDEDSAAVGAKTLARGMGMRQQGILQGNKGKLPARSKQEPGAQGLHPGQPKERPNCSHDRHLRKWQRLMLDVLQDATTHAAGLLAVHQPTLPSSRPVMPARTVRILAKKRPTLISMPTVMKKRPMSRPL